MSDYLWDKSGEPEADAERLEELLSVLRHAGVAPELPFEVEAKASTRAGLFSHAGLMRPARLAAAAALLLAVLAGALVLLRPSSNGGERAASNAARVAPPRAGTREQADTREQNGAREAAESPSKESAAPEQSQGAPVPRDALADAKTLTKPQRREPAPREAVAGEPPRRVLKAVANGRDDARDSMTTAARAEAFNSFASPEVERRVRAKERLVYALRLTSEALKEVRGRASGVGAGMNAFDGRSPLR
jgi:hypothetical protein